MMTCLMLEFRAGVTETRKTTHCRDSQAVGNLLHQRSCGREGGRGDIRARIAVNDHCSHNVHSGIDDLKHGEGFGEITGILHLRHDTEERHVGDKGENDVGDSQESFLEGHGCRDIVLDIIGCLNSDGNHGDKGGDENTNGGDDGHPKDLLRCPRKGRNAADYQTDNSKDNGAGTVIRDCVEEYREGENVASHQEDNEQQLADKADLSSDRAKE